MACSRCPMSSRTICLGPTTSQACRGLPPFRGACPLSMPMAPRSLSKHCISTPPSLTTVGWQDSRSATESCRRSKTTDEWHAMAQWADGCIVVFHQDPILTSALSWARAWNLSLLQLVSELVSVCLGWCWCCWRSSCWVGLGPGEGAAPACSPESSGPIRITMYSYVLRSSVCCTLWKTSRPHLRWQSRRVRQDGRYLFLI